VSVSGTAGLRDGGVSRRLWLTGRVPDDFAAVLHQYWDLPAAEVTSLAGGMNSQTWLVRAGGRRLVGKSVLADQRPGFAGGLALAARLEDAGIPAGAPLPTRDGELVARHAGRLLALLRWVDGAPLTSTPSDQAVMGRTLAQVHRALVKAPVRLDERFPWLELTRPALDVEPWIRPALSDALTGYQRLGPRSLTWGAFHADPAPEAFRHRVDTGACGLIDWADAARGPLLYDLASAAMYVGGPPHAAPLLAAYTAQSGPVLADEIRRALVPMLRLRWALQAYYFAHRIAANDLTGISGPADNAKGLADARRALQEPFNPGEPD
jgi:Ser/Thr protein kinase RdoA (MazF antagonist)